MALFSPILLAIAAGLLTAGHFAHRLTSPLAKLPGPKLTMLTSLLLKWHELKANRREYIHDLHVRYGPVVRVAPNEASFTSPAAVKEIYCSGGSGYDKTEFYDLFKVYGRRYVTLNDISRDSR